MASRMPLSWVSVAMPETHAAAHALSHALSESGASSANNVDGGDGDGGDDGCIRDDDENADKGDDLDDASAAGSWTDAPLRPKVVSS
jgi:hypothetical protein